MKTLTNQKSNIIATFRTRVSKSTAPSHNYPAIGDVMGVGESVVTITEENQKNFTVPYELSEDEITLLSCGMEDKITLTKSVDDEEGLQLHVVNAELCNEYLTITIQQTINEDEEDRAIELFKSELEGYEINCLEFRDNHTNKVYYIEVDSIHNTEMEFDVID